MIITSPLTLEQRVSLRALLLTLEQSHDERQYGDLQNEPARTLSVTDQLQCDAVSRALVRVHGKGYGLCVDCNKTIGFARLTMEPQTLRCNACQSWLDLQTWCDPLARTADAFLRTN